ncbi:MAG: plastocyanin/azurin family copper-binding protein [Gemmatimonadota bacterium]
MSAPMRRPGRARARGRAMAVAALALAACVSERADPTDVGPMADCVVPVELGGALVPIRDFQFVPDTMRVAAGTRVAWVNCDAAPIEEHTTTADDGLWDSGLMDQPLAGASGGSFVRVFGDAGAFPYHCTVHPFMRGVVLVE